MCEITEKWKCSEDEERGWGRGGGGAGAESLQHAFFISV